MRPPTVRYVRWLLVAAIPVAIVLSFQFATAAPPSQQGPTCQWTKLANGQDRTQLSLVPMPGTGVLAFAGADLRQAGSRVEKDLRQLDLTSNPQTGTWSVLGATGNGPGERAEHASILRQPDEGVRQMVTYGGIDEVPKPNPGGGGGGTFTWQSPLLGGGSAIASLQGAYAPTTIESSSYRLELTGEGATWSAIGANGQPRTDHSAVWYPDEDAMIVFGGRDGEDAKTADNSTWRLTLGDSPAWTRLNVTGGPSKRFAQTAVYDSTAKRMLVFGGTSDWKTAMNDLYALDLSNGTANATWQKVNTGGTGTPFARYDHGAVYLPSLNRMVAFGGTTNGKDQLSDLWMLDLSQSPPVWTRLQLSQPRPPGVWGLAAAYSPAGDYAVFYGGQVGNDAKNEAWALKCQAPAVPTTPAPATNTATTEPSATATEEASPTSTTEPASPTPTTAEDTPTPQPTRTPVTLEPGDVVVPMAQQSNSGLSGRVILRQVGADLLVIIELTGDTPGSSHPAHIHLGRCPTPGQVTNALNSVENGFSSTTLPGVSLASVADGNHVVNVHQSASQMGTYVACGDIPMQIFLPMGMQNYTLPQR